MVIIMWGKKVEVIKFRDFMDTHTNNQTDFFIENLQREVIRNPQQAKQLKRQITQTLTVLTSFLALTTPAMASTSNALPPEIDAAILKIQLICLALSISLATLCGIIAGSMRILGMSGKAQTWTTDITKGLIQVLVTPVAVGIIVTAGRLILKPFAGYIPF